MMLMMKRLVLGMLTVYALGRSSFLDFQVVEAFSPCSLSHLAVYKSGDDVQRSHSYGHCSSILCTASSTSGRRYYGTRVNLRNSLFRRGGDEEQRHPAAENALSASSSSSLRAVSVSSNTTAVTAGVINGRSLPSVSNSVHAVSSSSSSSSSLGSNSLGSSLRDSIMVTREKDSGEVVGIGGKGGVVYNVNILKRNLLQETMNAYKAELYHILNSPMSTEYYILTKLAALVQGSPVVTTTDSNLMDGSWTLAYQSKHSFVQDLRKLPLDLIIRRDRRSTITTTSSSISSSRSGSIAAGTAERIKEHYKKMRPAMRRRSGKEVVTRHRRIFGLETLKEDEDPYVLDETSYFGGLFGKQKTYRVQSLTRSSLRLTPVSRQYLFFGTRLGSGKQFSSLAPKVFNTVDMRIIYSDGQLCIIANDNGQSTTSTNSGSSKSNKKDQTTYKVYTKHEAWTNTNQRLRRKIRFIASFVKFALYHLVPGRHADDVYGVYTGQEQQRDMFIKNSKDSGLLEDPIVKEIRFDSSARLRVLRLGSPGAVTGDDDADDNSSNNTSNGGGLRSSRKRSKENASWEGMEDPFVHLTADDRQKLLKQLSVGQVEQAGNKYRSKTIRDRWLNPGGVFGARPRQRKFFHPPSKDDQDDN